jgi:ankyrin repeat protein
MKPSRRPSSAIPEPGSPKPARRIVRLLLWGQFLALLAVLVLTQSGAMDSSWIPAWLGPGDAGHLDPLAMAVETRNLAELERLLDAHGDRIDVFDGDRMNPLLRAAAGGWIAGCRTLLDRGAKVNVADERGNSPLCHAIMVRGSDGSVIVELLLDHGADVNGEDCGWQIPLIRAAFAGRADMVEILLRRGANVARRSPNHWTALHWAAVHPDKLELVSMLLRAGADPRAVDDVGVSPIDVARRFDNPGAIPLMQGAK